MQFHLFALACLLASASAIVLGGEKDFSLEELQDEGRVAKVKEAVEKLDDDTCLEYAFGKLVSGKSQVVAGIKETYVVELEMSRPEGCVEGDGSALGKSLHQLKIYEPAAGETEASIEKLRAFPAPPK